MRLPRFAVLDDFFHVGGEVGIEDGDLPGFFFVRFRQRMHSDIGRPRTGSARTSPARTTTTGSCPSMTTSAPARARARTPAKSLAASASEIWMMFFAIDGIILLLVARSGRGRLRRRWKGSAGCKERRTPVS